MANMKILAEKKTGFTTKPLEYVGRQDSFFPDVPLNNGKNIL